MVASESRSVFFHFRSALPPWYLVPLGRQPTLRFVRSLYSPSNLDCLSRMRPVLNITSSSVSPVMAAAAAAVPEGEAAAPTVDLFVRFPLGAPAPVALASQLPLHASARCIQVVSIYLLAQPLRLFQIRLAAGDLICVAEGCELILQWHRFLAAAHHGVLAESLHGEYLRLFGECQRLFDELQSPAELMNMRTRSADGYESWTPVITLQGLGHVCRSAVMQRFNQVERYITLTVMPRMLELANRRPNPPPPPLLFAPEMASSSASSASSQQQQQQQQASAVGAGSLRGRAYDTFRNVWQPRGYELRPLDLPDFEDARMRNSYDAPTRALMQRFLLRIRLVVPTRDSGFDFISLMSNKSATSAIRTNIWSCVCGEIGWVERRRAVKHITEAHGKTGISADEEKALACTLVEAAASSAASVASTAASSCCAAAAAAAPTATSVVPPSPLVATAPDIPESSLDHSWVPTALDIPDVAGSCGHSGDVAGSCGGSYCPGHSRLVALS